MSFDYLSDLFGKFRKRKTRFSEVESKAIRLIKAFVERKINDRDFANEFNEVGKVFHKLMEVNGEITIDEDTPLWMNKFLGCHFVDWYKYQQVKWYFEEHPKEAEEYKENFARIKSMRYDETFREACKKVLKEMK